MNRRPKARTLAEIWALFLADVNRHPVPRRYARLLTRPGQPDRILPDDVSADGTPAALTASAPEYHELRALVAETLYYLSRRQKSLAGRKSGEARPGMRKLVEKLEKREAEKQTPSRRRAKRIGEEMHKKGIEITVTQVRRHRKKLKRT